MWFYIVRFVRCVVLYCEVCTLCGLYLVSLRVVSSYILRFLHFKVCAL